MTRLGGLIVAWQDDRAARDYAVSDAALAAKVGVTRTTLGNWKRDVRRLPEASSLRQLAREIGLRYEVVLDAALRDAGYLVTEELTADAAPMTMQDPERAPLVTKATRPPVVPAAGQGQGSPQRTGPRPRG